MNINMVSAEELVLDTLNAGLVPFISSSPGIGKSSLAKELAKRNNMELIDIRLSQCDPADLNGMPFIRGKKAEYMPMSMFPIEGDDLPKGKSGWILLLDEFNSAPMSVQAAA